MDAGLADLLNSYPELHCVPGNKIRCTLTGHEMPWNYEAVSRFVQGSRFQRVKNFQDQLRKNECYFEDKGSKLFCKLTKRYVAKEGEEIERHINGRRFRTALSKAHAADENGNKMETGSLDAARMEPRLIDDSDESAAVEMGRNEGEFDSGSSCSSLRDVEAVDNGQLYPELAFSDEGESDYDFDAMDTELDTELTTKRKVDNTVQDSPAHKRRRC